MTGPVASATPYHRHVNQWRFESVPGDAEISAALHLTGPRRWQFDVLSVIRPRRDSMRRLLVEKHWAPRWKSESVHEDVVPVEVDEDEEDQENQEDEEAAEADWGNFRASTSDQEPEVDGQERQGGLDEGEEREPSCTNTSRRRSPTPPLSLASACSAAGSSAPQLCSFGKALQRWPC